MRFDRYTVKSQEAIESAQRLASERGHQELAPEHLLAALLADHEGIVPAILEKLGVTPDGVAGDLERALEARPRVQGGSPYLGDELRQVLERAEREAERLKDEYVSV